jgi:hypothetical protein
LRSNGGEHRQTQRIFAMTLKETVFHWLALVLLSFATGCGAATGADSEVGPSGPATAAEAAKFLDLTNFPLMPNAEEPARCVAELTYNTPATPREAFDFQAKQLQAAGWSQVGDGQFYDQSCSGLFHRAGFHVSVSAIATGDREVMITFSNHGNIDLSKLPVPPGCEQSYAFPTTAAYVAPESAEATVAEVDKLLLAAGWVPYGSAGDTRYYKQNAVKLLATVMAAPAQGGKTMISYSSTQLSADIPAPADALDVRYSEPPVQMMVDFPGTLEDADAWYRQELAKQGWQATLDQPTQDDSGWFVIYRNPEKDMLDIHFQKVKDFMRLKLKYSTAAEVAEMDRRFEEYRKEQEKKRQSEEQ